MKLHNKAGEEVPINQDRRLKAYNDTLSSREVIMRSFDRLIMKIEILSLPVGQYCFKVQKHSLSVQRSFERTFTPIDKSLHKRAYVGSLTLAIQSNLSQSYYAALRKVFPLRFFEFRAINA